MKNVGMNAVKKIGALLLLLSGLGVSLIACQLTNEDCVAREACKREGLCQANPELNRCVATQEGCKASRFCFNLGLCKVQDGQCIASSEEDCRNSIQCKEANYCLLRKGECVEITKDYCSSRPECTSQGLCSLNSKKAICIAGTAEDCQQSEVCKEQRRCLLENEKCVLTDQACKDGQECEQNGACSRLGDKCVVNSDDDCRESVVCRQEKKCFAEDGKCVETRTQGGNCKSSCTTDADCTGCSNDRVLCDGTTCAQETCKDSQGCKDKGQCTREGTRCIAKTKEDCNAICLKEGLCSVDTATGSCQAASNDDCAQSEACTKQGRCSAQKGECVVVCLENLCKNDADCRGCRGGRTSCVSGRCATPGSGESTADGGN